QGVSGHRHRYFHPVGLSASGGSVSLRRAGIPAAQAGTRGQCDADPCQHRAVWRDHRQRAASAAEGLAIMSLVESLPRVRALRSLRADGLIPWIVPLAIVLIWQVACVTGFV